MEPASSHDVAVAAVALAGTDARDPSHALLELVGSAAPLLGVTAGAALISDGAVHGVASAGSDRARAVVSVGFGQGPGGECARSGRPVLCDDLSRERPRWLAFVAKAAAAGVTGAWAVPIHHTPGTTLGALLLLGHRRTTPDLHTAELLAGAVASALTHAHELDSVDRERRQLRSALRSRIPIEQAKGALAAQAGVDVDTAFQLMRTHARRHGLSLTDVAAAVMSREIDPALLTADQ